MTPPLTIPFSSVILGDRARSTYSNIESLADSIADNGLVQPIVLVPLMQPVGVETLIIPQELVVGFGLDAGGRRYHALKHLLTTDRWDGILHHAATSEPGRPGYVLKGEAFSTPLQRLMTELAENLDRSDLDWRDEIKLLVKAYKLSQKDALLRGEEILMRDFGAMLGVEYNHLQAAVAVHDDLIAHPERYKDCEGVRQAKAKLLAINAVELNKVLMARTVVVQTPGVRQMGPSYPAVAVLSEPEQLAARPPTVIPLTSAFICCNSLEYMESLNEPTFDHIVTDPDYGVSVERLSAGVGGAHLGVAQETINESLIDLYRFMDLAWRVIKDQGFLVFWYDLDHHEKLQSHAVDVGFSVMRWPLTWIKSDYRSNAAPAYNFCKNVEWAMVCRKPNAVLAKPQMSSVFNYPTGNTVKEFGHPFAKPLDVSKWILSAISIPGQTVYDPFLGSGAIAVAAAEFGLKPVGSEIDEGHYANAVMNLQRYYRKTLGEVTFS